MIIDGNQVGTLSTGDCIGELSAFFKVNKSWITVVCDRVCKVGVISEFLIETLMSAYPLWASR